MKLFLFFIVLLFIPVHVNALLCPKGEYLRITKYGPRGPYVLCSPIPKGYRLCGYIKEQTFNGFILIDRICEKQCK